MNDKIEIMFIAPWFPLPRLIKRMDIAKNVAKTGIVFWDKNDNNHYPNVIDNKISVFNIKLKARDGISVKRFFSMFLFYRKAYQILNSNPIKCIHTTKIDLLFLVYVYTLLHRKKEISVIYEISDMHDAAYNDSKNIFKIIISKLLFFIEKESGKCVENIIVTSPDFWDKYYKKMFSNKKYLFIPNASEKNIFEKYKKKTTGKFTVGYIGNLCHYDQLEILINLADELDINIFIAGGGINECKLKSLSHSERIFFYGRYNYKEEIASLYSKVDCIYALYDYESKNTKIALPNRLYDAACCGLPIIASKNTTLGNIVKNYDLGVIVERNSIIDIKQGIQKLQCTCKEIYEKNASEFIAFLNLEEINSNLKEMYCEACSNE